MSNIIRHDPLEDLFRGFFIRPVDLGSGQGAVAPQIKVDIKEAPERFTVHAELPGIKREDIQVQIDGNVLTISAERKQEQEVKENENVLRTERYFGQVTRSFQLAQDIDEDNASAKFTDGVLDLNLPKKIAPQSKKLLIE